LDGIFLFAFVSSLGVINKLLEFFLLKTGLMRLDTADAYWDLLANTVGAILLYGVIRILEGAARGMRRHKKTHK